MIRRIPQNGRWEGVATGLYGGSFRRTFSVDLDREEGAVGISPKLVRVEDSTTLSGLSGDSNRIVAFERTNADCTERIWALAGNGLYRTDSTPYSGVVLAFDPDTIANSPTSKMHDLTSYGNDSRSDSGRNKLFVTSDSDVSVLNDTGNNAWTASWWNTKQGQPSLDTNQPHPIEEFQNRKIALIGDGNKIHTISRPSDTQNDTITNGRLTLPNIYVVNTIFCTSERAWIGCFNRRQERGAIIEWDGFSQTYNKIHEINGLGVISGVNYAGAPIALENTGRFLEYTGSGFIPMVRDGVEVSLVPSSEVGRGLTNGTIINSIGPASVHWRGMVVGEDGLVYINLSGSFNGGYGDPHDNPMAGIWCLNPRSGRLYNKHCLSDSGVYGHQLSPGLTSENYPGGLYWVPNDALLFGRNLLAGGIISSDSADSTAEGGIWALEDWANGGGFNQGYLTTQYVHAHDVEEFWDTLWIGLRQRILSTGNSVIVKARGLQHIFSNDTESVNAIVTWTSTTTFTATRGAGATPLQVGDEVEILKGANAGEIVHITNISGAQGALQTFTIDETVGFSSGTSRARFERWKKLGVFDESTKGSKKFNVGIDSSFIQFKVLLRSTGGGTKPRQLLINDLVVTSKPSLNIQN